MTCSERVDVDDNDVEIGDDVVDNGIADAGKDADVDDDDNDVGVTGDDGVLIMRLRILAMMPMLVLT